MDNDVVALEGLSCARRSDPLQVQFAYGRRYDVLLCRLFGCEGCAYEKMFDECGIEDDYQSESDMDDYSDFDANPFDALYDCVQVDEDSSIALLLESGLE